MKLKDQILLEQAYASILSGISKGSTLEDIAKKHKCDVELLKAELRNGVNIEMEHTKNKAVSKKIALDHLFEDPKYYTKLNTIEHPTN